MPSLTDFWTQEVLRQQALLTSAQAEASAARLAENAASTQLVAVNQSLADAQAAAEVARKALAGIPLPADGDPLLLALRQALRNQASARAQQVVASTTLGQARALRQQTEARASELTGRLATTKAQAKAEDAAGALRAQWVSAASSAPLNTLPSRANTALTSFKVAAKAVVEADFPTNVDTAKDFLARVRARRLIAQLSLIKTQQLADEAQTLATAWDEATGRASAKLPALRRDFAAASDALQTFFAAPLVVEQARLQLKTLAERSQSPLSAAQRADLFATGKAALLTERENALKALADRDSAQETLFNRQQAYTSALLPLQVAHPASSESDLRAMDAALATKFTELNAAKQALIDADGMADLASHRQVLQDWFAAVPEALWEGFETLETALASLEAIKALVPATLLSDLQNAEDALVAGLEAARDEVIESDRRAQRVNQILDEAALAAEAASRRQQTAARAVGFI